MNKLSKVSLNTVSYIFLAVVLLLTLMPLMYVFFASFKTNQEILASASVLLPKKFLMDNYIKA